MRRLGLTDALLVGALIPLWLAATALQVRQITADGLWWVGVYVAASDDAAGAPEVRGFWSGVTPDASGLRVGDRLTALDGAPLAVLGPLGFFVTAHEQGRSAWLAGRDVAAMRLSYVRDGTTGATALPIVPVHFPWRLLPLTTGLAITGLVVLLKRPGTRIGRAVFLGAVVFALHWTWFFGGSAAATWTWLAVFAAASTCMYPLVLRVFTTFPDEVAPARAPRWPWLFAVNGPIALTAAVGTPLPAALGLPAMIVVNIAVIAAILAVLARNFRRAGPVGRRQLKWQLIGMYLGLVPVFAADLVILAEPDWWWLHDLAAVCEIAIPIGLFIGVVRYNLYDVDRLITTAVAYSVLSALLFVAAVTVVPPASALLARVSGLERGLGASAISVLIAVALVGVYRSVSPRLEGVLFRERLALEQGVRGLLVQLTEVNNPAAALGLVGTRLTECFGATSGVVFRRLRDDFVPLVALPASAGAPPGSLAADDPLVRTLAEASGPVALTTLGGGSSPSRARPPTAPTALALPVRAGGGLAAIVTLGAKGSGDVYLASDLALLAAVAQQASAALERLDVESRTAVDALLLPRKYELVSRLGEGGMGLVLAVRHRELGALHALKMLPAHVARIPGMVERFRREATLMATLRHPNVVRVFDADAEEGVHYLVMEYVEGDDLASLLRAGPLPVARALDVARQVAAALAYAHALHPPVVHRDVTPANVLVERATGRVVVTDFGIAKILDEGAPELTETGAFLGKRRYAAPEQLRGAADVDARVDVYALGVVTIEMLTGNPPPPLGEDEADAADDARVAVLPASVPQALRDVLSRATASDREHRPRDGGALLVELAAVELDPSRAAAADAGVASAPAGAPEPTQAVTRRGRVP